MTTLPRQRLKQTITTFLRNSQDQGHFNHTLISFFQLAEITDLAYVDTGDMALDADTYGKALDALTTDTCTP